MEYILDAFWDTLKILPFLFLVYLLLEVLEHKFSHKTLNMGRFGPLIGSAVGILPQCGFSVAATTLFNKRIITMGTLLAVYLSTSDEAIPILLSHPDQFPVLLKLIGIKFLIGLAAGLVVDLLIHRQPADSCYCSQCPQPKEKEHHHHTANTGEVLWHSGRKTLQIALFLFVVQLILGVLLSMLGEERLATLLLTGSLWQPFAAALIGLIPTCVPSILITQLFLEGGLTFGSAVAGLCTGAGMGILVLLKENREPARIAVVIALLYCVGALAGLILNILPI